MVFTRRFPDRPIVGVGAVVLDGHRVLLVKRARPPLQDAWSLPGGVVELGEALETAVSREVREETGLAVVVGPVVDVVEHIEAGPDDNDGRVEYHYVLVEHLCAVAGGRLGSASDAADARFVDIGDLESYGLTTQMSAVIQKAVARSRAGGEV